MPNETLNQEAISQAAIKIAVLETQVQTLTEQNAELKATMNKLFEKIDLVSKTVSDMNTTLSEARGGWKMLMLMGGAGAALGSAVSAAIQHWRP